MTRSRLITVAIVGVGLALLAGLVRRGSLGLILHDDSVTAVEAGAHWRVWSDVGVTTTYRFAYRAGHADQRLLSSGNPGSTLAGSMAIAGELALTGHGPASSESGSNSRFRIEVTALTQHELSILGRQGLTDDAGARALLVEHPVFIEVDGRGLVQGILFAPDTPDLSLRIAHALALEAQVVLPATDESRYSVTERSPRGTLVATYERTQADGDTGFSKSYDTYTRVDALTATNVTPDAVLADGAAVITLDTSGAMTALTRIETLLAEDRQEQPLMSATASLTLERLGAKRATSDPVAWSKLTHAEPGELILTAAAEEHSIREQAGELTGAVLLDGLARFAAGGRMPDHSRWFAQATALLRLQPALCDRLVLLFAKPLLGTDGRALVLDLLAATGTPAAQRALVSALESAAAQTDSQPGFLLQRLSLVRMPTAETLAFAERAYDRAGQALSGPAAYALGAVIGNMATNGDPEATTAAHDRLRADLEHAATPSERSLLLGALGNAGLAEDARVMAGIAATGDPDERAAAATGLRRIGTPDSIATLLTLASDADPGVQGAAIVTLGGQTLDEPALAVLGRIVAARQLYDVNADALVSLLSRYPTSPTPRQVFELMLAQGPSRSELEARLRTLLE